MSSRFEKSNSRSVEIPDPYKSSGDAYERKFEENEWEKPVNGKTSPYLAHIKSLSSSWRSLGHLADWMQVGTTPLRWNEIKNDPDELQRRARKTNIKFIEYQSAATPKTVPIQTPEALRELLQTLSHEPSREPPLRLFVVEDLSREVIELLGSHFDIDPMFFREQINDFVWNNTHAPEAMPSSLITSMKHRQWFRIRNVRLRYFNSEQEFEDSQSDAKSWNVVRRPDDDRNHWHYQDKEGAVVSIMRTRTAIWIGQDKNCGNGTVGIVLLDPTVTQGRPLWYDRSNWLPTPGMDTKIYPSVKSSVSWFEDIVEMTAKFPWFELRDGYEIDTQILAKPTIYTICAEWLVVCDYVKTRLSQIEWELELPGVFRAKGDAIETSLTRLHTWRRQIPVFREMVNEALEQALPAASRLTLPSFQHRAAPASPQTYGTVMSGSILVNFDNLEGFEDIVPDFKRILAAVNELQERVDRLTSIVTTEMSIEDSRRGLEESHNTARITWLATVFIPLSFISGLFSMSEDITTLRTTFQWYFAAAVPLTLIVMATAWIAAKRYEWLQRTYARQNGMGRGSESKKVK